MRSTVLLRHCPDYDPERIRVLVREALDQLDLHPRGRTLVKPNCVASGRFFPHAYTRPEVLEGVMLALRDRDAGMSTLTLGERCGITVPTRMAFHQADYYPMADRVRAEVSHFEEEPQVEIPLSHTGRLRDRLFTPRPVAQADFFVNCPKFKAHPWTTVTFSMKNYIGIQDDRHRLLDHDYRLDRKVADLQHVLQPQLVVIDAITAGEGRMLTPMPFPLELIIAGNNQVAVDAVCCRILGLDPLEVPHIRLAHDAGFGPVEGIDLLGDVSLDEARERAQGFEVGLVRVEDYFRGTAIRAYGGRPPSAEVDYCWGGCPGAMEEAIEILRLFDAATDSKMPPLHVVFGHHEGVIDAAPGEKVVFMGDCAEYSGPLHGAPFELASQYVDSSAIDATKAVHQDIYAKMVGVERALWEGSDVVHIRGCPVSVAEQVLVLVKLAGLNNPYFDPAQVIGFNHAYLSWRARAALKRVLGQPYAVEGAALRGDARV